MKNNKIQNALDFNLDTIAEAHANGELLLAVTGVDDILAKKVKYKDSDLKKAVNLPKEVAQKCKQFLETKGFEKINLNLKKVNFLEVQEAILEEKDSNTMAEIIKTIPDDLQTQYVYAVSQALDTLESIVPRLPMSISKNIRPSDLIVGKFNRAYRTINEPLTIMDDLLQGCLSYGQVETLIIVYPNLYKLFVNTMLTMGIELAKKDQEVLVGYNKLKQLSILFMSNTVPPDLQTILQSNFAGADVTDAEQPTGAVPDLAKQNMTKTQRIENK